MLQFLLITQSQLCFCFIPLVRNCFNLAPFLAAYLGDTEHPYVWFLYHLKLEVPLSLYDQFGYCKQLSAAAK